MAWSLIATATGSDNTGSSKTSVVTTSGLSVQVGDHIAVGVGMYTGSRTVSSMTDTAGNTYTYRGRVQNSPESGVTIEIWDCVATAGHASNLITANFSSTQYTRIVAVQSRGMDASQFDSGYTPAGNTDSSSPHATPAANTAGNDEVVMGFFWSANYPTFSNSNPSVNRVVLESDFVFATNEAAAQGSWNVGVAANPTTYPTGCFARAFKVAAAGTTYYQSAAGNMPAAAGALSAKITYGQAVAGDMPAAQGEIIKKIMKALAGSVPAPGGALIKGTSKQVAGSMPSASGAVAKKTSKALAGEMPAGSGSLSSAVVSLAQAVFGNMPAPVGSLIKMIGKAVAGAMPAAAGELTKKTSKQVVGSVPAPAGDAATGWRTAQAVAGEMPAATGALSWVLNPVVTARRLMKIIGGSFKKLIGG